MNWWTSDVHVEVWNAIVVLVCAVFLGTGFGAIIQDCRHEAGDCSHARQDHQVQEILDCIEQARR